MKAPEMLVKVSGSEVHPLLGHSLQWLRKLQRAVEAADRYRPSYVLNMRNCRPLIHAENRLIIAATQGQVEEACGQLEAALVALACDKEEAAKLVGDWQHYRLKISKLRSSQTAGIN